MDITLTQAVNNLSGREFIIGQLMIGITCFGIFALGAAVGAMLAALICFSRVYVGVHYVSDIFGGITIGAITAFGVSKLFNEKSRTALFVTKVF